MKSNSLLSSLDKKIDDDDDTFTNTSTSLTDKEPKLYKKNCLVQVLHITFHNSMQYFVKYENTNSSDSNWKHCIIHVYTCTTYKLLF